MRNCATRISIFAVISSFMWNERKERIAATARAATAEYVLADSMFCEIMSARHERRAQLNRT